MEERRRAPRINEENEVTLVIFSEEDKLPKERLIDNYTKDISRLGAKIHTNILLPVDSLIELEFTSRGLREQINALGIVKWVKVIIEDESYEAGVEFCGAPAEVMERLGEYISWRLKAKAKLIKKSLSPTDSDDVTVAETEEQPQPTAPGDISVVQTEGQPPIVAGDISVIQTEEQPQIESEDVNVAETKEQTPTKSKQRKDMAIISLLAIILIISLLKIFGFIPEFGRELVPNIVIGITYVLYAVAIVMGVYGLFHLRNFALALKDGFAWWGVLWTGVGLISAGLIIAGLLIFSQSSIYPPTSKKIAKIFPRDSITTESVTLPAPPVVTPATEATPVPTESAALPVSPAAAPEQEAAPASVEKQKTLEAKQEASPEPPAVAGVASPEKQALADQLFEDYQRKHRELVISKNYLAAKELSKEYTKMAREKLGIIVLAVSPVSVAPVTETVPLPEAKPETKVIGATLPAVPVTALAPKSTPVLEEKQKALESTQKTLEEKQKALESMQKTLEEKQKALEAIQKTLEEKWKTIGATQKTLEVKQKSIEAAQKILDEKEKALEATQKTLEGKQKALEAKQKTLLASPIATKVPKAVPATLPAPPIAVQVPKVSPVPEAKQKMKVIGNSDSKRYHLPGMKYYYIVKPYHRVEFNSEEDAIKAGYHKAPR